MKKTLTKSLIAIIVIAVVAVIILTTAIVTVPTGHTGVVVTFGKVEDYVLNEGLHPKLPWQLVVKMDNRAQKSTETLQAFSSDIQQVNVICSVNFTVDRETSQNLYRNVGANYYKTVMQPRILENIKAIFTKYSAENLVESREKLADQIQELLAPEMKTYGIDIANVSIEDIDFTDVFTDAVEAKQVAEQSKLKAQIEQDQKVMEAEAQAKRQVIEAEAESKVAKINADAQAYKVETEAKAEAEANKMVSQSLSPMLLEYVEMMQWNGILPEIFSGDGSVLPIINNYKDATATGETK